MRLAKNKHGTHVLIKFICLIDYKNIDEIFATIVDNFNAFAMHANGLPVIKRILAKFTAAGYKERLVEAIEYSCADLAQNDYGNYAIQVAFDVRNIS